MADILTGSVRDYLEQLASAEPAPGGGSAAGFAGAMGAALLCMSARFTIGRDKYAAFEEQASSVLLEAEVLRAELQQLTADDAAAYGAYRAATALPKTTDEEKTVRQRAIQAATHIAGEVPLAIARKCVRLLTLAGLLADHCNPYLVSDVIVATHNAMAGFNSAMINVRMNQGALIDATLAQTWGDELSVLVTAAPALARAALVASYQVLQLPIEGDLPL